MRDPHLSRLPSSHWRLNGRERPQPGYAIMGQVDVTVVVCPETLTPLERVDGGLWSASANRFYPTREGLVFMGYPARDAAMISSTMEVERDWQGTGAVAERNLEFLRESAPTAVDLINLAQRFVERGSRVPRALELGCGNGWVSWLLAEAGFDTWMCDFEANSLATGLNLEHPNLGPGKRFVTDARYAPFADRSMDLVLFKQFVHHVSNYRTLFQEANRVLCDRGIMALMEPVRSVRYTLQELRRPDPHEGHQVTWPDAYLRAIRHAGFEVAHQTVFQQPVENPDANLQRRVVAWLKEHAQPNIDDPQPAVSLLAQILLRLIGSAQLVVIARKTSHLPAKARPSMNAIDPETLIVDNDDLAAYADFPAVLHEAAKRLGPPRVA